MKPAPIDDDHDEHLTVTGAKTWAAGVPGVVAGLRHANDQMGVRKWTKTLLKLNQPDGFDCPGCAWPDPHDTSTFEFCENGAKAVAEEATDRRIDASFFAEHGVSDLVDRTDFWLGQQGRLTEPMLRPEGSDHYRPIAWDDAFELIGTTLRGLASPDRAVFYTSGRTSNEAAFVSQLFARALGTNNLPDCSNMCHESTSMALGSTIGIGKGTVSLEDIHHAELLLVIGQNPGTNHPRMLTALQEAKQRGATIVAINPLAEAGLLGFRNPQQAKGIAGVTSALSDLHLPIRVGADLALFTLINRMLVDDAATPGSTAIDRAFLDASCDGFDDLVAHLATVDTDDLLAATSLAAADVQRLFELVRDSERIVACWAMGLTQHRQAVATIQELTNTLLLRGSIGKQGAGLCPVRGHSNVQGDRTMGIYEKPSTALLDSLQREFGFDPPRANGLDTVEAIAAMSAGEVDVFIGMGGNFVAAAPDTDVTAAAMERCRLTVQVSTKLNRSHAHCGGTALILPCLGRTERDDTGGRSQFVTVEDSMSMVHATRGSLAPASDRLRSEVAIVCGIAAQAVPEVGVDWDGLAADYRRIRGHIQRVIPGFDDFERRVQEPGGFVLPNPPRDSRTFATVSGKAGLTVNHFQPVVVPPGRLLLQTVRSHDQYNTTIYGLDDRYRGIRQGRRVLFLSAADIATHGLRDGDHVDIVSEWTDHDRRAPRFRVVEYAVPVGTCAAYFPETNVLVPLGSVAEGSNTPTSKAVVVRLERCAD